MSSRPSERIPPDRAWRDRDGRLLDTADALAEHLRRLDELRVDPHRQEAFWADIARHADTRRSSNTR